MADKRSRVPLDQIHLCFFSAYDKEDGSGLKYAIDYEDADDAHYQMTENEAKKLERYLKLNRDAVDLPASLQAYIAEHGFWKLEDLFEQAGIHPQLFYFYDIE